MNIESLEDLQAGDIMLASQSDAPARTFIDGGLWLLGEAVRIGKFTAGHAAMVVPGGRIVEAMPHGARVRPLVASDWSDTHIYFRLPEDYSGQALDAATMALAMVGTPYSIASYIYLGLYRFGFTWKWLKKRIDRRLPDDKILLPSGRTLRCGLPEEEICSVLVDQAWSLTGYSLIHGTVPQVVTPGMLALQLWHRAGVLIGGAGLLV